MHINDAAYLAGLFDGEGSVYFKKTRQKNIKDQANRYIM